MGVMTATLAAISIGTSLYSAHQSNKQKKESEKAAQDVRDRMYGEGGSMDQYMQADVSNPFDLSLIHI